LFGFILICVLFLGNRCVQEVSLNSNSSCDHDVSTESEWRGPGRVPTMYGTIWGWWPQFLPLHVWLPGEYTLVQVWLLRNPCNHAVMGLIFYEVVIHFLICLSVHSPNKYNSRKSTMKIDSVLLETENEEQITSLGMLAAFWFRKYKAIKYGTIIMPFVLYGCETWCLTFKGNHSWMYSRWRYRGECLDLVANVCYCSLVIHVSFVLEYWTCKLLQSDL